MVAARLERATGGGHRPKEQVSKRANHDKQQEAMVNPMVTIITTTMRLQRAPNCLSDTTFQAIFS
jgi:hypothetical protein